MELGPYLEDIHMQLDAAAQAGGDEARALAERLAAPLDAAIRLALQDALAAAADEITVELAPGSVEVRLRGREPEFVVTPPPAPSAEESAESEGSDLGAVLAAPGDGDDTTVSRINLRMPEHLKARVEQAADREGLSVNAWLVRAAASRLERMQDSHRSDQRAPYGTQRYRGWAR
jgi:hypothetical protein